MRTSPSATYINDPAREHREHVLRQERVIAMALQALMKVAGACGGVIDWVAIHDLILDPATSPGSLYLVWVEAATFDGIGTGEAEWHRTECLIAVARHPRLDARLLAQIAQRETPEGAHARIRIAREARVAASTDAELFA